MFPGRVGTLLNQVARIVMQFDTQRASYRLTLGNRRAQITDRLCAVLGMKNVLPRDRARMRMRLPLLSQLGTISTIPIAISG